MTAPRRRAGFDWDFLVILVAGLLIAVISTWGIAKISGDRRCLRAGWPQAKVPWTLEVYCVKRVDQTDVVVPVREAEKGRQ